MAASEPPSALERKLSAKLFLIACKEHLCQIQLDRTSHVVMCTPQHLTSHDRYRQAHTVQGYRPTAKAHSQCSHRFNGLTESCKAGQGRSPADVVPLGSAPNAESRRQPRGLTCRQHQAEAARPVRQKKYRKGGPPAWACLRPPCWPCEANGGPDHRQVVLQVPEAGPAAGASATCITHELGRKA